MCGIIGYIGSQSAPRIIFKGLERLEYRGYDSAGIAVLNGGEVSYIKNAGKLANLAPQLSRLPSSATIGMGHTRWATHGAPTTENSHPHVSNGVALIHNGIIENYVELKKGLIARGTRFASETDSEVVLHLLVEQMAGGSTAMQALIAVLKQLEGAYSLGIICEREPNTVLLAKHGSPLVVGFGKGENFFASDALALIDHTNEFVFLNDGELATVSREKVEFFDLNGAPVPRTRVILNLSGTSADKCGYRHYMVKEIHEQPSILTNSIQRLVDFSGKAFKEDLLGLDAIDVKIIDRIHIIACGTAYYSGMVAKYGFEPLLKIPVEVELASEFRYRAPCLTKNTLVIPVSQSGETADTLACVKYAREQGCQVLAVCNVMHASIPRAATATLHMDAGPEIGVASTKAFTSMILNMYILALAMTKKRTGLSFSSFDKQLAALRVFPALLDSALGCKNHVEALAEGYYEDQNCIFMGRGASFPISLEGALKLKEISYIHAEGYAGGELKHGPIALVDRHMPIVAIAPMDKYHEKMISNVEEVKARGGRILGIGSGTDERFRALCDRYISCPQIDDEILQTILSVIPLQLFAYYVAVRRGTDVDQPRNLAKSVTVE
jgi:glucosamine--fructose-6-phosphate aminotransferase (isomerizing)